ncbi:MAG TPA: Holliday junction resolvase RuvX [Phycisphaerales bacterium]|nr:Holliday junction resolvase RuvX [Phycisphaerales bacterium]HRQ76749.1 Holliday junction resolvase RuvX [Phycisphaerales bacterium]
MRYLAIDLGDKRTGFAVGDDFTRMAAPVGMVELPVGPRLIEAIAQVIRDHEPGAIVLGLPLNMDGTEGDAAKRVRMFGEQVAAATGLPIHVQDERLTSYAADQRMAQTGRTHKQKKQLRDALAAAEILRDFLDARAAGE